MSNDTFFWAKQIDICEKIKKLSNGFIVATNLIDAPADNKIRYVMCNPQVHKAVAIDIPKEKNNLMLRKRLVVDFTNHEMSLEVYNDRTLIRSWDCKDLSPQLALAIEAEIYNCFLSALDYRVNQM